MVYDISDGFYTHQRLTVLKIHVKLHENDENEKSG